MALHQSLADLISTATADELAAARAAIEESTAESIAAIEARMVELAAVEPEDDGETAAALEAEVDGDDESSYIEPPIADVAAYDNSTINLHFYL
jgi:hypothetical protein